MDSGEIQYLFKETRLNLEPPSPSSVVTIRVPSGSGSRGRPKLSYDAEDETTFRLKNLATAASIYRRKWHDSPKNFLWRVLEEGTLLSIRAVDVSKKDKAADASLIINFHFTVPIQTGCVVFSDPEEHDALCVHVLDQACYLYTFTLRPDLFKRRGAVDAGLPDICKVQSPAGLSFKYPHRMVAVSANTLLVTVNDGGMIRFDKQKGDDGKLERKTHMKSLFLTILFSIYNAMEGILLQCSRMGAESTKSLAVPGQEHDQVRKSQHGIQHCDIH